MKNYNKTFTYQLSVDVVAAALLKAIHPFANDTCCAFEDTTQEELEARAEQEAAYYERLVEAILDPIQDNAPALGHLYNSINGWVKTETPLDSIDLRKKTVHVPFSDKDRTYNSADELWEDLEQAEYISLVIKGQNVVGNVNYVDNGINISFNLRSEKGYRKLDIETIHIKDIVQAEFYTAETATKKQFEKYQTDNVNWLGNQ